MRGPPPHLLFKSAGALVIAVAIAGYAGHAPPAPQAAQPSEDLVCDPDNGGLTLPPGFCALVVADGISGVRHMVVAPNGDIFVARRRTRGDSTAPVGVLALRDSDGDGRAEVQANFADRAGTGIALHGGYLYFGPNDGVVRFPLPEGSLEPSGPAEVIVSGLPAGRRHRAKSLAIDGGDLYVNIGAPSNTCQEEDRTAGSPGIDPCPQLATRGGIWKFDANTLGQTQTDGERFATGLRNVVALTLHPTSKALYGVQHGRDQLHQNWPELFSEEDQAEKPAEELVRIRKDDDYGWPYCYYDSELESLVLAPEYGGDGKKVGRCRDKGQPMLDFPAHWAPNAILFYTGDQFPEEYKGGAFIAFHGSWNRAPLPQAGYKVVYVPFDGAWPKGDYDTFADGFAGEIMSPRDADYRPGGLAQGPDGSLYISSGKGGRIWRVLYKG